MLSTLASQYHSVPVNGSSKKRKIEASEDFPDLGGDDGIDADVKEILRRGQRRSITTKSLPRRRGETDGARF